MENPETWLWIWLAAAVLFGVGEIAVAGSLFLLPFAVGAIAAVLLAAVDLSLVAQWLAFVLVSGGSFLALRPIARRLDAADPVEGIGARRLIGERGRVLQAVEHGDLGLALINREEWRIESLDDTPIAVGAMVRVVEIRGTRAIVVPLDLPAVAPSAEEPPPSDPDRLPDEDR